MFKKSEPNRITISKHLKLFTVLAKTNWLSINDLIATLTQLKRLILNRATNLACFTMNLSFSPYLMSFY